MPRIAVAGLPLVLCAVLVVGVAPALTGAATPTPTASPAPFGTETPIPTAAVNPTVTSRADEIEFDRLSDEALKRPLVFGPDQGSLPMTENQISIATAGVTIRDFAVHIQFTNPASSAEHPWDYGLLFRAGDDGRGYRFGITSTNSWFLALDTGDPDQSGSPQMLNFSANAQNTIDLFAISDHGYVGVNGQFVAALDLSARVDAGQIAAAATFFADGYIAGGATPYEDFLIWSFDEESGSPVASAEMSTPPVVATFVPVEATVASPEATETFALGPIGLMLDEANGSGASGVATLAEVNDGAETAVNVLITGAPAGAVAIIHRGTCADLDPTPAFLLHPLDANGASTTTIATTLHELRVMDEYAIAVYTAIDDLSAPIACGEIPTAG